MTTRCAYIQYLAIFISGLLIISTSVNAGSFRDFVLDEGLSNPTLRIAQLPAYSQSASCMQCHDGSTAKSIALKHADSAMSFTSHGSSNHPVGMSYDSFVRKSPASYIALARLDSRIKLENGEVTCISCHARKTDKKEVILASGEETAIKNCSSTKDLTTGSNQTQLCMSCHAM